MKATAEAHRVDAGIPARWRGAEPLDRAALTEQDMRRIRAARGVDELNVLAFYVRRGLRKQAERLGAMWSNEQGLFVPKEESS